jgi:branched-chain amino acid transport system permease protein
VTKFLQLLTSGIALGAIYALIAFGFVVVYKATRTFNFAQGGFVLLGTYLTYQFAVAWEWPFYLSMGLAALALALVAALLERLVLRRMIGQPPFSIILVTLGILLTIEQLVRVIWDQPSYVLANPWGTRTIELGGVTVPHVDLWAMGLIAGLLGGFFLFFRYSRLGLGIRASAIDQEAAAAQGIDVARSFQVSWALAGAVGAMAGVMLTARGGAGLSVALSFVALRAFPAMILGGLDSLGGAVAGGILVGLAEVMSSGYLDSESWLLGENFSAIVPYVLLVVVMLWRPNGLFGTKAVERV